MKAFIKRISDNFINSGGLESPDIKIIFDKNGDITKTYKQKDYDIWKRECDIYLYLLSKYDKNIPEIYTLLSASKINNNYQIIYKTQDLITLRKFLNLYPSKFVLIINELFTFLSILRTEYKFIHGKINLDNVFISRHEDSCIKFHVIDYSCSIIDVLNKYKWVEQCWDSFTMYTSLMLYLRSDAIKYKKVILNLIKENCGVTDTLFIEYFNMYCIFINENDSKQKYKSI